MVVFGGWWLWSEFWWFGGGGGLVLVLWRHPIKIKISSCCTLFSLFLFFSFLFILVLFWRRFSFWKIGGSSVYFWIG